MILKNDFNSQWRQEPVGILRDADFFSQSPSVQKKMLERFSWVEFRFTGSQNPALRQSLRRGGFFYADTLLNFRIALDKVPDSPDLAVLKAGSAAEKHFQLCLRQTAPFENERFNYLPGLTGPAIQRRYITWGNDLIKASPQHCLRVSLKNKTQGWFLAAPSEKGLNLTLAMLAKGARISGMLLYQKALREYCRKGERLGWASFSGSNTAVLNIYSRLGAHFLEPQHCWFWAKQK